ncbi:deoxycytidylate deaminase isoform X2 [Zootoca vivipara]|uniref:deoxycytidylate deaminase isoform X2 n=1 Tax=Zootoca vivipara TaxID=8524 RepID=UPI00293BA216|nr:deoxycytidylate deaminase isoform X2 [Zootoca vivipara]
MACLEIYISSRPLCWGFFCKEGKVTWKNTPHVCSLIPFRGIWKLSFYSLVSQPLELPSESFIDLCNEFFSCLGASPTEFRYGCETPCKKRDDYLEWPEYFMAVAFLSAQRSKDPNSQVGACIVNSENKIVGIGYNGMPNGCSDDLLPWTRIADSKLDTKYPYVCHAELNAIMNKNSADVKGCSMYVALFPCNECAKLIIQAGIKEVIFMSDKYHDTLEMTAARRLFDLAGIIYSEITEANFGSFL